MKIGSVEFFKSEKENKQFITTLFLTVGIPIIPLQSSFANNKLRYPIPLNKKSLIKNYLGMYLLILSFFMLIFNVFLGDNLLFSSHINPFYDYIRDWPLETIEVLLTFIVLGLAVYFTFFYGKITEEESIARRLVRKSEYWNSALPGRNLMPICGPYYNREDQLILIDQMIALLFRMRLKLSEEEREMVKTMTFEEKKDMVMEKWERFITTEAYLKHDEKTVALAFGIINLERIVWPDDDAILATYEKIKSHMLNHKFEPEKVEVEA